MLPAHRLHRVGVHLDVGAGECGVVGVGQQQCACSRACSRGSSAVRSFGSRTWARSCALPICWITRRIHGCRKPSPSDSMIEYSTRAARGCAPGTRRMIARSTPRQGGPVSVAPTARCAGRDAASRHARLDRRDELHRGGAGADDRDAFAGEVVGRDSSARNGTPCRRRCRGRGWREPAVRSTVRRPRRRRSR